MAFFVHVGVGEEEVVALAAMTPPKGILRATFNQLCEQAALKDKKQALVGGGGEPAYARPGSCVMSVSVVAADQSTFIRFVAGFRGVIGLGLTKPEVRKSRSRHSVRLHLRSPSPFWLLRLVYAVCDRSMWCSPARSWRRTFAPWTMTTSNGRSSRSPRASTRGATATNPACVVPPGR